ncbi:fdrA domain protein [Fusibacter bizertensis]|uniref:FdrA domain protein n=1 Tax=Fusibacter bizertensis TaxID=1488331 RepID=A0ABT6NBL8_9FIRM|nr:fdrA domain protein [Fusibacter bizertensis]MDH8677818.1 fdrA domain protein [Fusibacter bizertensis]
MKVNTLFKSELRVVNIGIESFFNALQDQQVPSAHVKWQPPAGGNAKMMELLEFLKK